MTFELRLLLAIFGVAVTALLLSSFESPSPDSVQSGYRGTGMVQVYNPRALEAEVASNRVPAPQPPQDRVGQPASAVYQNVPALGDVDAGEFLRLMAAITEWVSPQQGCAYCHADGEDLSSDSLYTKVVSRRMIEMTRHINRDWGSHVGATGVTCYSCHRGQPVPANIWHADPGPAQAQGALGNRAGQNAPTEAVGLTSLPYDPFAQFLTADNEIRVISDTALPAGNRRSIKQTEGTYGLMVHMSKALGVNCTFCHNTRSFMDWDQSSPQRLSAWHGIRMVRDVNISYIEPLARQFPAERLGPLGDAPKVSCATCHQGAYKPLFGANMLRHYPELGPAQSRRTSLRIP